MVVGFNHNFRYKGQVYHVQTEDGGRKKPYIITLLYQGGTILASKKTSYADIVELDNLSQVVEELMKEQHKEMLRRLKAGEFDEVIGIAHSHASSSADNAPHPAPAEAPPAADQQQPSETSPSATPPEPVPETKDAEPNLDDLIFSYLAGDGGKL